MTIVSARRESSREIDDGGTRLSPARARLDDLARRGDDDDAASDASSVLARASSSSMRNIDAARARRGRRDVPTNGRGYEWGGV